MISADVYIISIGAGGLTRDVRITVRSDADGIGSAELRDRHGVRFEPPGTLKPGCIFSLIFEVHGIPAGQFPVFVWAAECLGGNSTGDAVPFGPFLPTGSIDDGSSPTPPAMCPPPTFGLPPSRECTAARNEASRIRNELAASCTRLRRLRAQRDGYIGLAVALYIATAIFLAAAIYTLASGVAASATLFGAIAGAVLNIVAGILFGMAAAALAGAIAASIMAAIKQGEVSAAEREYDRLSEQFRSAAMDVRSMCCPADFFEAEVTLLPCP